MFLIQYWYVVLNYCYTPILQQTITSGLVFETFSLYQTSAGKIYTARLTILEYKQSLVGRWCDKRLFSFILFAFSRILIDQIDWLIISFYTYNSSMVAFRMSCKFWQFLQWTFETFANCSKITIKRCMAEIHTKHCKRLKQSFNNGYMIFLRIRPFLLCFYIFIRHWSKLLIYFDP